MEDVMLKSLGALSIVLVGVLAHAQEMFSSYLPALGPGLMSGLFLAMALMKHRQDEDPLGPGIAFVVSTFLFLLLHYDCVSGTSSKNDAMGGASLILVTSIVSGILVFPPILFKFQSQPTESKSEMR